MCGCRADGEGQQFCFRIFPLRSDHQGSVTEGLLSLQHWTHLENFQRKDQKFESECFQTDRHVGLTQVHEVRMQSSCCKSPADPRQMFGTWSSFILTADQIVRVSQLELQNVSILRIKWKFSVRLWGSLFLQHHFLMGSPRGLFLDPLGAIFKKHGVSFHRYADDSQIYPKLKHKSATPLRVWLEDGWIYLF